MSLNIARFPMIGIETESPTREHYRREAAALYAEACRIADSRKYGTSNAAYQNLYWRARQFESIAARIPDREADRSAA